ncbi:hypothetical protein DL89DRAFT_269780 [Linderina pennispora]|uniref:RecQ-mediated genome instability protein 1 n=1 Tax=Linderina pennispora TaxID=61395 RepID=A0A1Y1W0U3_9FUNG|nr:uncharacterized protein DL89DRAFT_269780 [Linderina pennispora]ORX66744.1 hypothetical protein DL89DRAFT_269780 [Linderina pennispora]
MIDRASVTDAIKRRYGVQLNPSWLTHCLHHINNDMAGTSNLHIEAQIRLVVEQLLNSEIGESCQATLSADLQARQFLNPPGAFLQIQEIMDIGVSKFAMLEAVRAKEDYEVRGMRPSYLPPLDEDEEANTGEAAEPVEPVDQEPKLPRGMLKLMLTDGRTRFSAVEMAKIEQLHVELPIGTKVMVSGGKLMPLGVFQLELGCVKVLGGAPPQYAQFTLKQRLEKILHPEGQR